MKSRGGERGRREAGKEGGGELFVWETCEGVKEEGGRGKQVGSAMFLLEALVHLHT